MAVHKLKPITNPQFEVELEDGTTKSYDLYDLLENLQQAELKANGDIRKRTAAIREVFGIDSLTSRQAAHLSTEVLAEVAELPESKKALALSRS